MVIVEIWRWIMVGSRLINYEDLRLPLDDGFRWLYGDTIYANGVVSTGNSFWGEVYTLPLPATLFSHILVSSPLMPGSLIPGDLLIQEIECTVLDATVYSTSGSGIPFNGELTLTNGALGNVAITSPAPTQNINLSAAANVPAYTTVGTNVGPVLTTDVPNVVVSPITTSGTISSPAFLMSNPVTPNFFTITANANLAFPGNNRIALGLYVAPYDSNSSKFVEKDPMVPNSANFLDLRVDLYTYPIPQIISSAFSRRFVLTLPKPILIGRGQALVATYNVLSSISFSYAPFMRARVKILD